MPAPLSVRAWPLLSRAASALRRHRTPEALAEATRIVIPEETATMPPVLMDDGDRARVTAAQPETTLAHEWQRIAGGPVTHLATRRFEFRNVLATPYGFFVAGHGVAQFGRPPLRDLLRAPIRHEPRGFFASAPICLQYFGHWLVDGLPITLLAEPGEALYVPHPASWHHAPAYLDLLGIERVAADYVFFDRMAWCEDIGQNGAKRERMRAIRDRLHAALPADGNRKVFIRRGTGGARRRLVNEDAVVEALRGHGFAITQVSDGLEPLLRACLGARVVVSLEGSHAMHALYAAAPGALHVTLNPADRFNNLFADYMPALGSTLATVVAERDGEDYRADIPRLLDFLRRHGAIDGQA